MSNVKWISSKGKKVQKKKGRTGVKTALIILLILVVGLTALTVSLGYYVDNLDTVYPNVWADGHKLSGLTLEEANRTLQDIGYESNADGVSVTVSFPDGSGFSITGSEAGFSLDAEEAALAAYAYGRGGTFFQNEMNYVRSYFKQTTLRDVSKAKFDSEYVRDVVRENTRMFNASLVFKDNEVDFNATSIVIVKGAGVEPADEDEVYDLTVSTLYKALEEGLHLTAEYETNAARLQEIDLEFLLDTITIEPQPAFYDPETLEITESTPGRSFDVDNARRLLDNAGVGAQIVIPLIRVEAEITSEQLQSLFYRDILYTSTTRINGTANRLRNITIASMAIDGKELKPGEVFSFNETVGIRTAEKGYSEASAYVNGATVQEIGGGICQVSSTIYDAVLHADLEVVERRNHMFTVAYLPLGNDATVNWGTIDFRFRNSTDYPMRIETEVDRGDLTVTLIGTKLDENYIVIDFVEVSTTPYNVVQREDPEVLQGSVVKQDGHRGHVVETYKYVYDADDNLLREEYVGKSSYSKQDRLILVPVENPDDDFDPDGELPADTPPTDEPTDTPPTDEPTDTPPTDEPTDTPPTDEPTDEPTDTSPDTSAEPTASPSESPPDTSAEPPPVSPPAAAPSETPAAPPTDEPPPTAQPQPPPTDPPTDVPLG